MQSDYVFSSESVTQGHPDKLCDLISDRIVAAFVTQDRGSRVVAESALSTGIVFVSVRFRSSGVVDISSIARETIRRAGYRGGRFNDKTCTVVTSLIEDPGPRREVLEGADLDLDAVTATSQATVFGFACDQSPALMPLPIFLAHALARRLDEVRVQGVLPTLTPDGKTQVGIEYRNARPARVHGVTLAASQHEHAGAVRQLDEALRELVIVPVFERQAIAPDENTRIAVNPEGALERGGPFVHAGLTGRKGGADTYGEYARRSDSALSGKDLFRVERIGSYAARHAAKNVVAAGLAAQCEVQLSYSMGLAAPASVHVETFGTGRFSDDDLARRVCQNFDFRVAAIARHFRLAQLDPEVVYPALAAYGHVGRTDLDLPWEATDKADALR